MDAARLSRLLRAKSSRRFIAAMAELLELDGRLQVLDAARDELVSVDMGGDEGRASTEVPAGELFVVRQEAYRVAARDKLRPLAFALEQVVRQRETIDGLSRYSLEKQRELGLLYRLGEKLNNITDRRELLEASVALLGPRIPSDYAVAAFIDPCRGQWRVVDTGAAERPLFEDFRVEVLEEIAQKRTPAIYDAQNEPPPFRSSAERHGSSVAMLPLHQNDELLGALLFGRGDGSVYSAEELHLLTTLGFIFAGKLADINSLERMLDEQERTYLEAMQSLAEALAAKDAYTARHSRRVAEFSVLLGRRIGLADDEVAVLRQAAMLHDLGKIGVPDAILNKPGRLDDKEFEVMQGHAAQTAAIMRPLKRSEFREIAAWHHERWDGNGYPDGLRGTEIPLAARIVAIADTWDAMTDDRVYRKGLPVDRALSIMERERNDGQWDPELLDAFIEMIREMQAARHEVLLDMFPAMREA